MHIYQNANKEKSFTRNGQTSKTNTGRGKFFAGGGPVLSYGMSGKYKDEYNEQTEKGTIHFGSGDYDASKPVSFGASIITGYELTDNLVASQHYNLDVSNSSNVSELQWKNHCFALTVSYFLR